MCIKALGRLQNQMASLQSRVSMCNLTLCLFILSSLAFHLASSDLRGPLNQTLLSLPGEISVLFVFNCTIHDCLETYPRLLIYNFTHQ